MEENRDAHRLRLVYDRAALKFTEGHLWFRSEGPRLRMGLTEFGIACLRGISLVSLAQADAQVAVGAPIGWVESVKATMDLTAPLAGRIVAANEAVAEDPTLLDSDPFGVGWLYLIAPDDANATATFMRSEAYAKLCADE